MPHLGVTHEETPTLVAVQQLPFYTSFACSATAASLGEVIVVLSCRMQDPLGCRRRRSPLPAGCRGELLVASLHLLPPADCYDSY